MYIKYNFSNYLYQTVYIKNYFYIIRIVLFKSFRNSKGRNKGNCTSKSNGNKIKLGGGKGATLSCFK